MNIAYNEDISAEEFLFRAKRNNDLRIGGTPVRDLAQRYGTCLIKGAAGWVVTIMHLGDNSYLME